MVRTDEDKCQKKKICQFVNVSPIKENVVANCFFGDRQSQELIGDSLLDQSTQNARYCTNQGTYLSQIRRELSNNGRGSSRHPELCLINDVNPSARHSCVRLLFLIANRKDARPRCFHYPKPPSTLQRLFSMDLLCHSGSASHTFASIMDKSSKTKLGDKVYTAIYLNLCRGTLLGERFELVIRNFDWLIAGDRRWIRVSRFLLELLCHAALSDGEFGVEGITASEKKCVF